jgi:hypothetical protein
VSGAVECEAFVDVKDASDALRRISSEVTEHKPSLDAMIARALARIIAARALKEGKDAG